MAGERDRRRRRSTRSSGSPEGPPDRPQVTDELFSHALDITVDKPSDTIGRAHVFEENVN